jgi:hypothetical protein
MGKQGHMSRMPKAPDKAVVVHVGYVIASEDHNGMEVLEESTRRDELGQRETAVWRSRELAERVCQTIQSSWGTRVRPYTWESYGTPESVLAKRGQVFRKVFYEDPKTPAIEPDLGVIEVRSLR